MNATEPKATKRRSLLETYVESVRRCANQFEREAMGMAEIVQLEEICHGARPEDAADEEQRMTAVEIEGLRRHIVLLKSIAAAHYKMSRDSRELLTWFEEEIAKRATSP